MKRLISVLALFFCVSGFAHATLIELGTDDQNNKLIYDDDYDITWYDCNDYLGNWWGASAWVDALSVNYDGISYDDWRLPSAYNPDGTGPDWGYDVTGSEMGHLYYTELGNTAGSFTNPGPFDNLFGIYWLSETSEMSASIFYISSGLQWGDVKYEGPLSALAVCPGRVGAVPVPEPGTVTLVGIGLLGIAVLRHKRRRLW